MYLWIIFRIPRVQSNGFQIQAAVKVDSCDDVSFFKKKNNLFSFMVKLD